MQYEERFLLNYMKVKYYCRKKKWTLDELAKSIGTTRQTVRRWALKPTTSFHIWLVEDALEAGRDELKIEI